MEPIALNPGASIHLIGICGTGMGALAGLLKARGFRVSGSDDHPYPPMSTELAAQGIAVLEGYRAENLQHHPDLVIVGNICRPDHPEAKAARAAGLSCASLPRAVRDILLQERRSLVVAGTHGKTTTAALTAFLLQATGQDPSFLIGGVAQDFASGYRSGSGRDFVIEGDEYDSAYFEKVPKFLFYLPSAAVITSVEHDHVDIYPTWDLYRAAFASFVDQVQDPGPLAVWAGDRAAWELAAKARTAVVGYGLDSDSLPKEAKWRAAPSGPGQFKLWIDDTEAGQWRTSLNGLHNLRNTLAALILCHQAAGVALPELGRALPEFRGVLRRQQLIGSPGGIAIIDDFAHHPTAVRETLRALAADRPQGRLLAAFEPRSATACRQLHQDAYKEAFDAADRVIIAPPGRQLPQEELLDVFEVAQGLSAQGISATAADSLDQVLELILDWVEPGDKVALLSNGSFGGLGQRLLEVLQRTDQN